MPPLNHITAMPNIDSLTARDDDLLEGLEGRDQLNGIKVDGGIIGGLTILRDDAAWSTPVTNVGQRQSTASGFVPPSGPFCGGGRMSSKSRSQRRAAGLTTTHRNL